MSLAQPLSATAARPRSARRPGNARAGASRWRLRLLVAANFALAVYTSTVAGTRARRRPRSLRAAGLRGVLQL